MYVFYYYNTTEMKIHTGCFIFVWIEYVILGPWFGKKLFKGALSHDEE